MGDVEEIKSLILQNLYKMIAKEKLDENSDFEFSRESRPAYFMKELLFTNKPHDVIKDSVMWGDQEIYDRLYSTLETYLHTLFESNDLDHQEKLEEIFSELYAYYIWTHIFPFIVFALMEGTIPDPTSAIFHLSMYSRDSNFHDRYMSDICTLPYFEWLIKEHFEDEDLVLSCCGLIGNFVVNHKAGDLLVDIIKKTTSKRVKIHAIMDLGFFLHFSKFAIKNEKEPFLVNAEHFSPTKYIEFLEEMFITSKNLIVKSAAIFSHFRNSYNFFSEDAKDFFKKVISNPFPEDALHFCDFKDKMKDPIVFFQKLVKEYLGWKSPNDIDTWNPDSLENFYFFEFEIQEHNDFW